MHVIENLVSVLSTRDNSYLFTERRKQKISAKSNLCGQSGVNLSFFHTCKELRSPRNEHIKNKCDTTWYLPAAPAKACHQSLRVDISVKARFCGAQRVKKQPTYKFKDFYFDFSCLLLSKQEGSRHLHATGPKMGT